MNARRASFGEPAYARRRPSNDNVPTPPDELDRITQEAFERAVARELVDDTCC